EADDGPRQVGVRERSGREDYRQYELCRLPIHVSSVLPAGAFERDLRARRRQYPRGGRSTGARWNALVDPELDAYVRRRGIAVGHEVLDDLGPCPVCVRVPAALSEIALARPISRAPPLRFFPMGCRLLGGNT